MFFETRNGLVKAVNGVSFSFEEGKTLGIVGESGSGKSQTAMSILQLFKANQKIYEGHIRYGDKLLSDMTPKQLRAIRGNEISMIFQEPMSSLNPVFTVGKQLSEVLLLHREMSRKQARKKALEMLEAVRIVDAHRIMNAYPFQLSGGMSQRVMIAMALACNPRILIADEPTTALDVIIQAEILRLMNELKKDFNTSILFITHDLGVIGEMADEIIVMYGGKIVEAGSKQDIFSDAYHPYTKRLIAAFLRTDINTDISAASGPLDFYDRECDRFVFSEFRKGESDPDWYEVSQGHFVAVSLLDM